VRKLYGYLLLIIPLIISSIGFTVTTAATKVIQLPQPLLQSFSGQLRYVARHSKQTQSPSDYVVRPGDTLSSIARRVYGSAASWPALWWINKAQIRNPNAIEVGQHLKLSAWHPQIDWLVRAAISAIPQPVRVIVRTVSYSRSAPRAIVQPVYHAVESDVYSGGSGFMDCVIRAESGGNVTAQNPYSSASGLFGFLDSTWEAITGLAGPARDYSASEQTRAFEKEYAEAGTSPWAPYDGC
jgi:LysM repeat protein